jgi:hypothetical protein
MTAVHAALVRDLVHLLSRDPLSVEDVVMFVGSVTHDPGVPMPVELRPSLPGVRSASLARYADSGLPYLLTVSFPPEDRPAPAELRAMLGDGRRSITGRGMPAELVFHAPPQGSGWRIAVIASLAGRETGSSPVASLTFRRDALKA